MDKIDLSVLNSAQMNALNQINGPVMVLAGAGSGKTRLVTYRIAYLVKDLGVNPENILAITFTNKAANEMKERLIKLLGEEANDIWISTFHSMCVKILRRHISGLKSTAPNSFFDSNFSIYTDTDKDKTIKTVLQNLKIDKEGFAQKVAFHISNAKNKTKICQTLKILQGHIPLIKISLLPTMPLILTTCSLRLMNFLVNIPTFCIDIKIDSSIST